MTAKELPESGRSCRRRDPRTLLLAFGVILFTCVLLVASDVTARYGAQSLIARAVQRQLGTEHRPSVHLKGTIFLQQVVQGRYDSVRIDVSPLDVGPLRFADVSAELDGVHLPFHDVLVQHTKRVVIDHTTEHAVLRYTDLNHYLTARGDPLTVHSAGPGLVTLTGTVTVAGHSISASAQARLSATGNKLVIVPGQFDTGITGLDNASRILLGQRFSVEIPLSALPFGQQVYHIGVHATGITVDAHGSAVVINPAAGSS